MQHTANFNLNKPDRADQYNIDHFNQNTENVDKLLAGLQNVTNTTFKKVLLDLVYPVGSIYWSGKSTNPGTLFGGTWTQIKDRFVWAKGDKDTLGNTSGNKTVTLTVNNMPEHAHDIESHKHKYTPQGTVGIHFHTFTPTGTFLNFDKHVHDIQHSHKFTPDGKIDYADSHRHNRGTMEITGSTTIRPRGTVKNNSGALSATVLESAGDSHSSGSMNLSEYVRIDLKASEGWTGETGYGGYHNHTFEGKTNNTYGMYKHNESNYSITTSGRPEQLPGIDDPYFLGNEGKTSNESSAFFGSESLTENNYNDTGTKTDSIGLGNSFSIMPPHIVKYCWERTA